MNQTVLIILLSTLYLATIALTITLLVGRAKTKKTLETLQEQDVTLQKNLLALHKMNSRVEQSLKSISATVSAILKIEKSTESMLSGGTPQAEKLRASLEKQSSYAEELNKKVKTLTREVSEKNRRLRERHAKERQLSLQAADASK